MATATKKIVIQRDKEFLLNAPEVSVFVVCLGLVSELSALDYALKHGELSSRAFSQKANAVLAHLNETAAATERFDIVMPVMSHGQYSPFFWRWFNWWGDYLKALSSTEFSEVARQALARVPTVNEYRPASDWATCRNTPAFTIEPS
jgi:hypothetical protein